MTRRSLGILSGLGLLVAAACTGGGSPNDIGVGPSDDAPTAPGAPSDPNAPPANREAPPFGGVAPPPSDGVPGSTPGGDCTSVCKEAGRACGNVADSEGVGGRV